MIVGLAISPSCIRRQVLPTDLPSLAAWYQFNTGITVTGSGVSQWNDQSGNARHLTQGTDTNRPAKQSDGSILFDGVDNYLATAGFTLNQPETVYVLGKQVTWTLLDQWFDGATSNAMACYQNATTPGITIYAGSAHTTQNDDLAVNSYGVIACVFNGASSLTQINNGTAQTGNPGANNAGGFTLASAGSPANFGNIQVKEVIIYSVAHDAATRTMIYNYLKNVGQL